jgi:sulfur-carrier protein adenylyltransferase/sulfurtransferase
MEKTGKKGLAGWLERLAGTGGTVEAPGSPRTLGPISARELLEMIRSGRAPLLVDVREAFELQGPLGSLPNVKNIPLGTLVARRAEIPQDRDVVLICQAGHRSARALDQLRRLGYTRVRHLEGGMQAVRQA